MTQRQAANLSASVRQRLLNLSRQRKEDFNLILSLYAIERLLYRLAQSPYADQYVLKGAVLFAVWTGHMHRPTRDLDLLGYGDASDETLMRIFREICRAEVVPDGMEFDPDAVRVEAIRQEDEYNGKRMTLRATLATARITLPIDIGFGDAVTPPATLTTYPSLLDFPSPTLRAYPREVVIAEKLHAMVIHDLLNSRMKDFYDLWILSQHFTFDAEALVKAISATFERRKTSLPDRLPLGLTASFANHPDKQTQWQAFLHRSHLSQSDLAFTALVLHLAEFLALPLAAAYSSQPSSARWPAGGPWNTAKG